MQCEVHIGNLIKDEMERQGRKVTWLAAQLHCDRKNIYKIYQRKEIGTGLLFMISKILGKDFFACYSNALKEKR